MNRILVPAVPAPGGVVRLGERESHHLLRVQRVARGSRVRVADGAGAAAVAVLEGMDGGCALLRVEAAVETPVAPPRVILLGMPKAPAVEEALTLGTEAGVTRFVLVEAERTPPGRVRPDRVERVLAAAVTQCGRPDVPDVAGPMGLADALAEAVGARFVATPGLAEAGEARAGEGGPGAAVTLAIGPEGGWSPAEQAALEAAGFVPLGLGPWILRAPTAVAVAMGRVG